MSALTNGPLGDGRREGRMRSTLIGAEPDGTPTGILIDGALYPLQGQPPVAVSHGWGDMQWIFSPFYRRTGVSGGI